MHQDRVLAYCDVARREGGEILLGGRVPTDPALARGCFVEPTVVRAAPHHTVCRDEVFGPFVTVTTFADDDEAPPTAARRGPPESTPSRDPHGIRTPVAGSPDVM
jgi:acyl-CoA reductase-like NAD-dependent aldehyde dehydrogenase